MFLLLRKSKPCSAILPVFTAHQIHPFLPRFFSPSPTQNRDPKSPHFSIHDYLIASFGFSPDKAARISKRIAHLKSPDKPDAVRRFLDHHGFSDADVKKLVTWTPAMLCSSPEDTLEPNLRALRDMGLSTSTLTQITLSNPSVLRIQSIVPRIIFWMDFLGGDEADLVKAFYRNRSLPEHDIVKNIQPKISLLLSHGFSNQDIKRIVITVNRFFTSSICLMENLIKRAKDLGFETDSGMFVHGLRAVSGNSCELLKKKMELLKSLGWSGDELLSALQKAPTILDLSENSLRVKMDFLMAEARCDPSYIASHPVLLKYSLETRLRPRNHILHLLESKGLSDKVGGFDSAMKLTDKQFLEKYILPHKDEIAGLHEAYLVAFDSDSVKMLGIELSESYFNPKAKSTSA